MQFIQECSNFPEIHCLRRGADHFRLLLKDGELAPRDPSYMEGGADCGRVQQKD